MTYNKYMHLYNQQLNQDIEHFHQPRKSPFAPLPISSQLSTGNFIFLEIESCYVVQSGFKLLGSGSPPTSASGEYRHEPLHAKKSLF